MIKKTIMRFVLIILTLALIGPGNLFSQDQAGAQIAFEPELHDYGQISIDSIPDGKVSFTVRNPGNQPLVLSNVRACCGTRVNDYTKKPIAPGETGFIEVQFRIAPQPHHIRRTITIQSNATNRQTAILRIIGEVVESTGDLSLQ
jgi:hypothetical protein